MRKFSSYIKPFIFVGIFSMIMLTAMGLVYVVIPSVATVETGWGALTGSLGLASPLDVALPWLMFVGVLAALLALCLPSITRS